MARPSDTTVFTVVTTVTATIADMKAMTFYQTSEEFFEYLDSSKAEKEMRKLYPNCSITSIKYSGFMAGYKTTDILKYAESLHPVKRTSWTCSESERAQISADNLKKFLKESKKLNTADYEANGGTYSEYNLYNYQAAERHIEEVSNRMLCEHAIERAFTAANVQITEAMADTIKAITGYDVTPTLTNEEGNQ